MTNPCCSLAVIVCSFISHLIGRETINIPEIFSGVHGFTGTTVENKCTVKKKFLFDEGKSSYFSAAKKISEVTYDLNSKSALTRKVSSSFIMPRMLLEFMRAKDNSIARLKIKENVM